MAVSHSAAATCILHLALKKTDLYDTDPDTHTRNMFEAMQKYSLRLGEVNMNNTPSSREAFSQSFERMQSQAFDVYIYFETIAADYCLVYPKDADLTECRIDFNRLRQRKLEDILTADLLRILASQYLILSNIRPFISLPILKTLDRGTINDGLQISEEFNHTTQFLLYEARKKDWNKTIAAN